MESTPGSRRSEYCGGRSTIPSSLGISASSASVWRINLEGVWFDGPGIVVSLSTFDWISLGADG